MAKEGSWLLLREFSKVINSSHLLLSSSFLFLSKVVDYSPRKDLGAKDFDKEKLRILLRFKVRKYLEISLVEFVFHVSFGLYLKYDVEIY